MILSMTGYGKVSKNINNKNISIELRALNSKNIDLKTRIPSAYREKEMFIRKFLSQHLKRGKIDLTINIEDLEEKPNNTINSKILTAYIERLKTIHPDADKTQLLVAALRLPDVLKAEKNDLDETEWQTVQDILSQAATQLTQYRRDEGASLEIDLKSRLKNIKKGLDYISSMDGDRLIRVKNRLKEALDQLHQDIDNNRFEQEMIYYLEKFDINEEKVRLKNHLAYFEQELAIDTDLKGKKLGFITQEMGREINTIGSKANDSLIQKEVVKMKDELEKIKEQVLNVL